MTTREVRGGSTIPEFLDRLVGMTGTVLAELRPLAESAEEEDIDRASRNVQAAQSVAYALAAVRDAPADLPIEPANLAALIKADLGPVTNRIGRRKGRRAVFGTTEDHRRAAADLEAEKNEGSDK